MYQSAQSQPQLTPKKDQIVQLKEQNKQQNQSESSSSQQVDFDPDSPNQKFFNLSDVKPLDLKAQWLGNTNQLINKFQIKLQQLKKEKVIMKKGFERFAENQNRFRISSLKKINFHFDKKALYREYMQRSRRTIEKMHPSVLINIFSYVQSNVFLVLARMRRVSKIFNFIYKNEQIINLFSQRDFGNGSYGLDVLQKWCKRYVSFCQTLLYYKQIKYTEMIPQNSIKQDLHSSIDFINQVYKLVYKTKNIEIGYFQLINKFMKQNRVVLALQSLSFGQLAVTRKASIIAFANYLAFNPASRMKQQITKTKYLKMIQLVQDQFYRDSLVVNSKISNFLLEEYNYQLAVFIDTLQSQQIKFQATQQLALDIVIFHYHNPLKSFFARGISMASGRIEANQISIEMQMDVPYCRIEYMMGQLNQSSYVKYNFMATIGFKGAFGRCLVMHEKFYYVMLIVSQQVQLINDQEQQQGLY